MEKKVLFLLTFVGDIIIYIACNYYLINLVFIISTYERINDTIFNKRVKSYFFDVLIKRVLYIINSLECLKLDSIVDMQYICNKLEK